MTSQLELFQLNYLDTDGITELNLYTDPGNNYGNTDYGLFEIPVDPVIITSSIIIRRSGILTLCEVEVYGSKFILYIWYKYMYGGKIDGISAFIT